MSYICNRKQKNGKMKALLNAYFYFFYYFYFSDRVEREVACLYSQNKAY